VEPLFATLSGEFVYPFVRGDFQAMRRLTDEARGVSQRLSSPVLRLVAHRLAAITALYHGALREARSEFEAILRLYDASQHRPAPVHYVHDPQVSALTYLAPVLWMLGFPIKRAVPARRRSTVRQNWIRRTSRPMFTISQAPAWPNSSLTSPKCKRTPMRSLTWQIGIVWDIGG
jgi:hypothetical protein